MGALQLDYPIYKRTLLFLINTTLSWKWFTDNENWFDLVLATLKPCSDINEKFVLLLTGKLAAPLCDSDTIPDYIAAAAAAADTPTRVS